MQPVHPDDARLERVLGHLRRELSSVTAQIESQSYRSFEVYVIATLIYLALSMVLRGIFALVGWYLFKRRPKLKLAPAVEGA